MSRLRVLQVGLGPHGRNWAARVVPDIHEVEFVGYVDTEPAALDMLREMTQVRADQCFESLSAAIAATQPEAMLVTTALPGHAPVTRAALDAGLHVLVEKPFAPSLSVARQLVDLAAEKDLVLMVSQNYRFFAVPRAIAALVRESPLGRLHEISIDFRRYAPAPKGRHQLEEQPLLVDMSIHHFDLLRMILDREPDRVYCEAWNPEWSGFTGPPVAVASIAFDGVVVSYRGSWVSAGPVTPWAGDWRLEFEQGEVLWISRDDDMSHDQVVVRPRQGETQTISPPEMPRTGAWATLSEFAKAVETGCEPETSGRNNLGTIAFVAAVVESATKREPVIIDRTGEALAI